LKYFFVFVYNVDQTNNYSITIKTDPGCKQKNEIP
jgi:hypothetical protein